MCGFAGFFSVEPNPDQRELIVHRMMESIAHRGPDGRGISIENHAALGHVRLAVIDLDSGNQPMTSPNGEISIVYNGEIYNYRAIREDLLKKGHSFQTNSDTEVILNCYLENGVNGFSKLRGMYAFVIWDKKKKKAILVRDPLGIKPLFYYLTNDGDLVFASEAKAILVKSPECRNLDLNSLHLLMNFRYVQGEQTLFHKIKQLQPGNIMEWETNACLSTSKMDVSSTCHENILDAMRDSIRIHLTSDVEVGAYLSGGIDSASIVAIAKEFNDRKFRTFTLNVGDDPNEAINAEQTAKILEVENLRSELNENIEDILIKLIWHLEVPKVNAFQNYELAGHASKYVKVVLSGLGGDELFLGYNLHAWLYKTEKLHRLMPSVLIKALANTGEHIINYTKHPVWSEPERAFKVMSNLGNWPMVYCLFRNIWDTKFNREKIYGPRLLDADLTDAFSHLKLSWPDGPDPVMSAASYEWQNKMVNDLLWQEDRCSMAHGLEVRVPFLDIMLKSSVNALQRNELMPSGKKKGYMKNMLRDVLPSKVMKRPKSGFQLNSPVFFNTHLKPLADIYLSKDRVIQYGLFNPAFISEVMSYGNSKFYRWHYFILYMMLMTHIWIDLFESGDL